MEQDPHELESQGPDREAQARVSQAHEAEAHDSDADDSEPEAAFWRQHVRIGVALYALGAAGVLAYVAATPHGRNRPALIAIDLFTVFMSVTVLRWVGLRLVTTRWREPFFFVWSALTAIFIGTAAALDGGTHSPLSYLLVLPLLFGGLAYGPKLVIALAGVAVASAVAVGLATPQTPVTGTLILVLATAIAGTLTVGGAINRARLTQRLVDLAALDSLTGCLSYREFHRRLGEEAERARRYGRTFGLVMVDVDNLKQLNDTGGHHIGDEALRSVSAGLLAAARASDVVGRLGGDEFAVLLPETAAGEVQAVMDRLRASLNEEPSRTVTATVSVGSTTWNGETDSPQLMLKRADEAMYAAKRAGRDRSVAWDPSIVAGPAVAAPR
jgi:diguanylate cyclase (GGDEF)-like protein